jgi:hypothetical protein
VKSHACFQSFAYEHLRTTPDGCWDNSGGATCNPWCS